VENALYYTLSTIAQTLAVLVAFVLFRLNQLDDDLNAGRAMLRGKIENDEHYEAAVMGLITEGPEAMQDFVLKTCGVSLKRIGGWEVYDPAYRAAKNRPVVQARLFEALKYALPTIGLCFVALPLTPYLKCLPWLGWDVMGIAVLLGVIFLGLCWELIKAAVID